MQEFVSDDVPGFRQCADLCRIAIGPNKSLSPKNLNLSPENLTSPTSWKVSASFILCCDLQVWNSLNFLKTGLFPIPLSPKCEQGAGNPSLTMAGDLPAYPMNLLDWLHLGPLCLTTTSIRFISCKQQLTILSVNSVTKSYGWDARGVLCS